MRFDLGVYDRDAILAAAHRFTDRCHVHVERDSDTTMLCRLRTKRTLDNLESLAGDFLNETLDMQLRQKLLRETEPIRRLVIAQAFSKVDLIHPEYDADPTRASTSSSDDASSTAE